MTVAVVVLAGRTAPLQSLLDALGPRFQVVVHLDAKAGEPEGVRLPSNAAWARQRFEIAWGGFNLVRAARAALGDALRLAPGLRRVALVSGDTLPVQPLAALEAALLDERREFVDLVEVPDDPALCGLTREEATARTGWVQPWRFQNHVFRDHPLLDPRGRAEAVRRYELNDGNVDHLRGEAERIAQAVLALLPPRPRLFDRLFFGHTWWALSRPALDLIWGDLHASQLDAYFQTLEVPDEHVIPTLLGNRQAALHALGREVAGTPVFVDHGDPARAQFGNDALRPEQFREAARKGWLFARKYDPARAPEVAAALAAGRYAAWLAGEG